MLIPLIKLIGTGAGEINTGGGIVFCPSSLSQNKKLDLKDSDGMKEYLGSEIFRSLQRLNPMKTRFLFLLLLLSILPGYSQDPITSGPFLQGSYQSPEGKEYGRYTISGDTLTSYSWAGRKWVKDFSVIFKIMYYPENDYMGGYNIIYTDPYSDIQVRIATGDVNGNGILDLWMSDSIYYEQTDHQTNKRNNKK